MEWNSETAGNLAVSETDTSPSGSSDPMAIDYRLHKSQISEIIQHICESEEPVVNGREGLKSVAVIEAIYESARTGKQVSLNS